MLIPTGFSPNGDGINDEFKIVKHLNIRSMSYFKVFNRWGEKIYTTTDINKGWDGSYEGQPSPSGVYVWYVEAFTYDNERIVQSGNVTLIR
jgi:gliding motility-associated-like protein